MGNDRESRPGGWPPPVSEDPRRSVPVPAALERAAKRFDWVWKFAFAVGGCVASGWGGHAAMTAWVSGWSAKFATNEAVAIDRGRTKDLEDWKRSEEIGSHDLKRDLEQLRKEFESHRAESSDVGLRKRTK